MTGHIARIQKWKMPNILVRKPYRRINVIMHRRGIACCCASRKLAQNVGNTCSG
jgi:hypothetical protein